MAQKTPWYCYDCGKRLRFTRRINCRRCWKIDKSTDRKSGGSRRARRKDDRRSKKWLRKKK